MQEPTDAVSPSVASYPWNVAIVGFGTVGQSVARILCSRRWPTLRLTHVCNRDIARKKVDWVPADVQWTDRIDDVLSANVHDRGGVDRRPVTGHRLDSPRARLGPVRRDREQAGDRTVWSLS